MRPMYRSIAASVAALAISCAHKQPSTPSAQYSALIGARSAVTVSLARRPIHPDAQRIEQDDADCSLAEYFATRCNAQKEDAAVYLPAKKTVVPMSLYSNSMMVVVDAEKMQSVLHTEDDIIEAHCHAVDSSVILLRVQERRGKKLLRIDPDVLRNRLLLERPSPVSAGGDIGTVIETEMVVSSRHARIEHRLYVVERGLPPRGISYGLSEEGLRLLKSPMGSLRVLAAYERVWADYNKNHCMFNQLGLCAEPSFASFAHSVNASGVFFLQDRGYIEIDGAAGTQ